MCRLAELCVIAGAVVAAGIGVGCAAADAAAAGAVVAWAAGAVVAWAAGAVVAWAAGCDVAVADDPQAMMKTKSMETNTAGVLRIGSLMF